MDIKSLTVGVLLVALGVAVGFYVPKGSMETFGAISSPDFASPYFSFGGVRHWAGYDTMENASTTCAIQSPAATTTLVAATAHILTAPTTTPVWEIGSAATAFATTTLLARHTFTANTTRLIVATTTATAPVDGIVGPNTWINVKQGGGGGSFVPNGTCTAVFREV